MPETNIQTPAAPKKWYKKKSGIALISVLVFFVLIILIYLGLIAVMAWRGAFSQAGAASETEPELVNMARLIDPNLPMLGTAGAPLQIVEFGDFMCPLCQQSHAVLRELLAKHPDKIAYYWRHFPVVSLDSMEYAQAAQCAHWQGKFWPYHDRLFQTQGVLGKEHLPALAQQAGIDLDKFNECLTGQAAYNRVRLDFVLGDELNLAGTPVFFVNGYMVAGHVPATVWEELVELAGGADEDGNP